MIYNSTRFVTPMVLAAIIATFATGCDELPKTQNVERPGFGIDNLAVEAQGKDATRRIAFTGLLRRGNPNVTWPDMVGGTSYRQLA